VTKHVREQLAQDCYLAAELKHRFRFNAIIKDCIKINHIIMTTEIDVIIANDKLVKKHFLIICQRRNINWRRIEYQSVMCSALTTTTVVLISLI